MAESTNQATPATVDNLLAQMSRGASVLNNWDVVLNLEEELVNKIFQAQFLLTTPKDWLNISFAFCQVFPYTGSNKLATYTRTTLQLSKPALKFLGDNQAFVQIVYQATGSTGTASKVVDKNFDPKKDADPTDPGLEWDDTPAGNTELTGTIPLSVIQGSPQIAGEQTQFVLDFPAGSFTSPLFDTVKDPDELQRQLKQYLQTHNVRYVIGSILTDLAYQIPQMAPKAFRLAVLTTNQQKNVFQIFIATAHPPQANTTIGLNEPIPDGYSLSVMFNKNIATQLGNTLMAQAWAFLQSNLIFPGHTDLRLGPAFTPEDALILGILTVDMTTPINPSPNINNNKPMLNIQKSEQFTPAGKPAFTVYGDDTNPNAWYIVPKAVWARDAATNVPLFSMVKYNSTGGGISGFCRFTVQLTIDPEQQNAVKERFKDAVLPQFDWISSGAYFTYTIDGKSTTIHSQPSKFGSQTVTFSLPLADQNAIAAFVNAFSPNGSQAGTFGISYELAANTRLPAVTVITKFDSTIAYQHQVVNKYATQQRISRDTWGHTTTENVQVYVGSFVKEMLSTTQAGTVTVTPGAGITPTLLDQVKAWAQTQLQKDVEQSVNTALSIIRNPTNDFSMQNVSSFTNKLETSNVVPWYFNVADTLSPFDNQTWAKLYSEVNQQQLEVTFAIQEDLQKLGIARLNLTFQYGDTPPETHTFEQNNQAAWSLQKPGLFDGSTFKSTYKYKYDVEYAQTEDGSTPPRLSTNWISTDLATVKIGAVELGLMVITFEAANIGWKDAGPSDSPLVKQITVDWYWLTSAGNPVLNETLVLTKEQPAKKSMLRSVAPTNNQEYHYALTFLMDDGTELHAMGLRGNTPFQRIDNPLSDVSVSVLPIFPTDAKAVILRATFDDEANNIHLNKQWKAVPTKQGGGTPTLNTDSFTDWNFKAIVANLNMATIIFSGTWVDKDNKQKTIPKTLLIGSNNTLVVSDTQKTVTAVVDASNVDFVPPRTNGVYQVSALLSYVLFGDPAPASPRPDVTTISFDAKQPKIQYFPTEAIDIDKSPVFYCQYTFTEITDNGDKTKVSDNWEAPKSTQSTDLPIIPGKPPATPLPVTEARAGLARPSKQEVQQDARTRSLFDQHDRFVATLEEN